MSAFHFEPYVHLAGLTPTSALISWGGFYFRPHNAQERQGWLLVDDEDLDQVQPSHKGSIGERSRSYGQARVEVMDVDDRVISVGTTTDTNHVWLEGLRPDTEYIYRITVDGKPWAEGERYDWVVEAHGVSGLRRAGRVYQHRFHTFPPPDQPAPLTFAVLGDFGIGIRTRSDAAQRQREVAAALERAVAVHDVRLILTTGDNIYLDKQGEGDTGDEDDDWFFSFYQPYRYILNRIPFYPAVGNHDSSDTEKSDDRAQLEDNYFLAQRFVEEREASRASYDPGLFYTFRYGADIQFVCIDTTLAEDERHRFFELPHHLRFIEWALTQRHAGQTRAPWRLPFSHHPPYCAGPHHGNTESMLQRLVPLFEQAGVQAVFSGHEHNFQYAVAQDVHYFVTGAGGKLRPEPPQQFAAARTRAWATAGHFLLVAVEAKRLVVTPLAQLSPAGELTHLPLRSPDARPVATPIVINRAS